MAASMKWVLKSVAAIVGGCCQLTEDESDIKILRLPARRKTPRSGGRTAIRVSAVRQRNWTPQESCVSSGRWHRLPEGYGSTSHAEIGHRVEDRHMVMVKRLRGRASEYTHTLLLLSHQPLRFWSQFFLLPPMSSTSCSNLQLPCPPNYFQITEVLGYVTDNRRVRGRRSRGLNPPQRGK